jgi:hypothetical protein
MGKPFISVYKSKGIEYASVCTPERKNGKKVNNLIYLGRVIDLKEGRFRNKTRGEFLYSLENGFSVPPTSSSQPVSNHYAPCKSCLNLGHVYCAHMLLERIGLLKLFCETCLSESDTLLALIMHRLLENYDDSHAQAFYEQTYSCILYPSADLSPQNISGFLSKIGTEAIRQDFHRRHVSKLYPKNDGVGILIDRSLVPNDINLFLTAGKSHGADVFDALRLIYVVDRDTLNPIYYGSIPGNVVDVMTLKSIIDELKSMSVNVKYSVLDAGYNSESNLYELYCLDIDFMTRLKSNSTLYKELLADNSDSVMNPSNRINYNKRLFFYQKKKKKKKKKF